MSKKKSFSGSTMTLKDFHGGSIPSDIPLPSAPGVIVRPSDRATFDRQGSFGNPLGRGDHRLRPSSSGSIRSLDDKTPFLTNTAHIGRNFDEDERKPLDGVSGPRRTVSDECIAPPPIRVEPRSDVGRLLGQQGSSPLSQVHSPGGGLYSARVAEGLHTGAASWNSSGSSSSGQGVISGGSYPNAWAVRKEVVGVAETVASPYVGQSNVSKFAQASALDKVSSGRWQTKPIHHQADVEVIRQVESPKSLHWRGGDAYHGINPISEREYGERSLVRHVERGLNVEENSQNIAKEALGVERIRSAVLLDAKERNPGPLASGGQPPNPDGKYGISGSQLLAEAPERPKLKLLPRSKPLEAHEAPLAEDKQKFQQPYDSSHMDTGIEVLGKASHVKPVPSAGGEGETQLVERPKLNLKPRSQPLEQAKASTEGVRKAVFGGARPRELVLKERGVDEVANNQEVIHSPVRVKNDTPRPDTAPAHSSAARPSDKAENVNLNHRNGKSNNDRRERVDAEKVETQKKSWRNENWRNGREAEKQPLPQPQQERPPSPETWRRPVEEPKPVNTDSSGLRFGKAASAVELAQAFSRSVSDPKMNPEQFPNGKGVPGRNQVPFSRLTGSTARPQINGY